MKLIERLFAGYRAFANIPSPATARPRIIRAGYDAANVDRLTSDWKTSTLSANGELRYKLRTIRARSRDFYMNNSHGRKFVKMVDKNVIGPVGITFRSKVKQPDGSADAFANKVIEAGWRRFCKLGNCTVDGQSSMLDVLKLIAHALPVDGELLVRKVRGYDNLNRFALQLIEADHLDEDYSIMLPNGNEIVMGVEKNTWGRPVAYHLLTKHPGDYFAYTSGSQRRIRVPAEEIIHLFIPERIGQARGIPWGVTSLGDAKMLNGYKEAAIVNARTGASKMGFYTKTADASTNDGIISDGQETDEQGNPITEAAPGIFEELPMGWDFKTFDPKYPEAEFQNFYKSILRSIAAGLDVSYNGLASDLENVNYSSIRQGVLDERDSWQSIQQWLIDHLLIPVFEEWLAVQLATGIIPLPMVKFDKFNAPAFIPRGWPWVDPKKDEEANSVGLKNCTTSRTRICAEKGEDFAEIIEELAEEKKLAESKGITFDEAASTTPATKPDPMEE